jgi:transposase
VPVMPSSLLDPVWVQLEALLPVQPEFHPNHPLRCHRRRIPDRVVFEHVVAALVHGSGYERIATGECSDTTIRRRIKTWAKAGLGQAMHAATLAAYDKVVGLDLDDILIDGCITKAVCGGPSTGKSPVDRAKGGIKRSLATEAAGIPIGLVTAGANCHDSPLLGPTLDAAHTQTGHLWPAKPTIHLDAGYDSQVTRNLLAERELGHEITWKGFPEPIENTRRWPCERTHSWMNGYGKLRRVTDEDPEVIDFYFHLAAAFVTVRALIRAARKTHRWDTRPTTRRLK